jgi:hypothetical protein
MLSGLLSLSFRSTYFLQCPVLSYSLLFSLWRSRLTTNLRVWIILSPFKDISNGKVWYCGDEYWGSYVKYVTVFWVKNAVIWDVMLYPDNGGVIFLQNVIWFLAECMVSCLWRRYFFIVTAVRISNLTIYCYMCVCACVRVFCSDSVTFI